MGSRSHADARTAARGGRGRRLTAPPRAAEVLPGGAGRTGKAPGPGPRDDLELRRIAGRADDEWERFLDRVPDATLFHRLSFLRYHPPGRFREHHLTAVRCGRLVGVISLAESEGGTALRSPYGGSFGGWAVRPGLAAPDQRGLVEGLRRYAAREGFARIRIGSLPAPYRIGGEWIEFFLRAAGGHVVAEEITHLVPLGSDAARRERGSARRHARRAERLGVKVVRGGVDDLPAFHAMLRADKARKGATPTHDLDELRFLFRRRPDDFALRLAVRSAELLAGILVVHASPRIPMVFYAVRGPADRPYDSPSLLYEHIVAEARGRGCTWVDLGTSSIGGEVNGTLSAFKESLGGVPFLRSTWEVEAAGSRPGGQRALPGPGAGSAPRRGAS